MPISSKQQVDQIRSAATENENDQQTWYNYCYSFHQRYWTTIGIDSKSYDIIIARALSILIWFYTLIIEFLGYSKIIKSSNIALRLLFNASYPFKDIFAIIYGSGAAAYGISIEIYFIIPFTTVNAVLSVINCNIDHRGIKASIAYFAKIIVFLIAIELAHQNFKCFTYQQSYKLHYHAATRAMLRQSIYLIISIMFLASPGLRAIYNAARFICPYRYNSANESYCNSIDFGGPLFGENDSCINDYIAMISSVEQLRIVRDIALFSIAFYSMYNKAFVDITGKSHIIHKIAVILFATMSCSFLMVNIDPFQFDRFKLFFDAIEMIIIVNVIILLILNLWKKRRHRSQVIMEANPTIFG